MSNESTRDGADQDAQARYLETRFTVEPQRDTIWRHITAYLRPWWTADSTVVDVGAGYCSFINNVTASTRIAVDLHDRLRVHADADVTCICASATDIPAVASDTADVVFASNLLEHLTRADIATALREFLRMLKPGGRLILMQPNYRLASKTYFDDYTHLTPLSDRSLQDFVESVGFEITRVHARFLPLTMKSAGGRLTFLVPVYLRSPIKPLAGQMLVIATKPIAYPE